MKVKIGSVWRSLDPRDEARAHYVVTHCENDTLEMTKASPGTGVDTVSFGLASFLGRVDTKRGWTCVSDEPYGDEFDREVEIVGQETLEELADRLGLDPDEWYAAGLNANTSRTGHMSVSARFKRIEPDPMAGVVEDFKADLAAAAAQLPQPKPASIAEDACYLMEIDVFDHHFGMLAWGEETDGDNYDMGVAEAMFKDAFRKALRLSQAFPVDRILVPLGNDLLHFDGGWGDAGSGGMTSRGTILDADTRFRKVYRKVRQLMVGAIDACREIAPVDVLVVPGNHGGQSEFTLGDSLECWYSGADDVNVDNGPTSRKYYRYGTSLIGFTHGDKEKLTDLPMIMAQERPEDWATTSIREWHVGHRHRRKRTTYSPVEDVHGVLVRELPSLIPADAWHYLRGYVTSRKGFTVLLHDFYGRDSGEFTMGSEAIT